MDAAFLVVVAKRGRRLGAHHLALTAATAPPGLPFGVGAHVSWTTPDSRVAIGAWQRTSSVDGTRWEARRERMTVTVGQLRFRGAAFRDEAKWAADVARAAESEELTDVVARLSGVFAIASVDDSGRGTVIVDPLAFRCLYHGEDDDAVVLSSRATLAAHALEPEREPSHDPLGVAWHAFTRYTVGERSGFTRVKVLPPDSAIEIRPGASPAIERRASSWVPSPAMRALPFDQLVDIAREGLAETLRAAAVSDEPRVVGLTGGRDSRVLLAVLLAEGLEHEFEFETYGPPDLADVVVAKSLAARFGLRHRVSFPMPDRATRPYATRATEFVSTTAGMSNVWNLRAARDTRIGLWVNGLVGEALRDFQRIRGRVESDDDLRRFFTERAGFGRAGLLRPEALAACRGEAMRLLFDDPAGDFAPGDRLHAFHLRSRVRFSRLGPLEELHGERRVLPFYSPPALAAALAAGADARRQERLHFEIVRRCSDALAKAPFAGPGWSTELLEGLPDAGEYATSVTPGRAAPKVEPWRARLQRKGFSTREEMLREILTDPDTGAWEVIDQERSLEALDRYTTLGVIERVELHGAVTAALWLHRT